MRKSKRDALIHGLQDRHIAEDLDVVALDDIEKKPPNSKWTTCVMRDSWENLHEATAAVERTKQSLVTSHIVTQSISAPLKSSTSVYDMSDGPLATWSGQRNHDKYPLVVKPLVPITGYKHSLLNHLVAHSEFAEQWRRTTFGDTQFRSDRS